MTKEQKEAIDRIKYNDIAKPLYCEDLTICNIDDLKTILSMIDEQNKIIDLMAEKFAEYEFEEMCCVDVENFPMCCPRKEDDFDGYISCIKKYFENKAKEN